MNLRRKNTSGNVLMVTLCTVAIAGVALGVYLKLTSNEHQLTMRSLAWNNSLMIAEGGIEEALTHAFHNYPTNLGINGWSLSGSEYVKERTLGDGHYSVRMTKKIPMEIFAEGFYPNANKSGHVTRRIHVITKNKGAFAGALTTKSWVQMNGNNVYTDSYDSRDPNKSTAGQYDPLKKQDNGDVFCAGGLLNSVSIGNANIWGEIYTGPTATVQVGPGGAIGDTTWQTTSTGIQDGAWQTDYNVQLPDITKPFASGTPPASGTGADGVNYHMVLGNGNYEANSFNGRVLVTGNAVLYVTSDIKFEKSDVINILPGASLKLYVASSSAVFSTIVNANASPTSFQYYGLSSNTSIEIKDNSSFTGTIYAPQADFRLTGNAQLYGSVVARTAFLNGNAGLHYDEALENELPSLGYIVVSWKEI